MITSDAEYYEQEGLWSAEGTGHDVIEVVNGVVELLGPDVRSVLDVGCGNGAISDRLATRFDVTAGDRSAAALRQVRGRKARFSADSLPFADRAFDAVISTDVIEHLSPDVADQMLEEMTRVARRCVVLCMPHREPLEYFTMKCRWCGASFHAHHHQRPFDASDFQQIGEFHLVAAITVGARWVVPEPEAARMLREMSDTDYQFTHAVCEHCGRSTEPRALRPGQAQYLRRVEAHRYLLAESGVAPRPWRSELVVRLDRRRDGSHDDALVTRPTDDMSWPPPLEEVLRLEPERQSNHLLPYPDHWYWLVDGTGVVVVTPQLPGAIFVDGATDSLVVGAYDHVTQRYVALRREDDGWYRVPEVRPDVVGYRLSLNPAAATEVVVRLRPRDAAGVSKALDVAFADSLISEEAERLRSQVKQLNDLLNLTESNRVAAEEGFARYYQLAQQSRISNTLERQRMHRSVIRRVMRRNS